MKKILSIVILTLVLLSSLFLSCQSNQNQNKQTEKNIEEETNWNAEEQELIAIVEKLLFAVGNSDFETLDSIVSDKANLGSAIIRDGVSKNSVFTIGEYFERQKNRDQERKPFYEPVQEYKIHINKGQIAFVWADATLYSYGVPRTNNIDNFTLIKEDGEWQFISISFTNTRLPEEMKKLDLEVFAKSYAQVWCSQRPNFVSYFFAEDGVLQINDGSPAEGTEAITNVVKSFMETFPDMNFSMDSLTTNNDKTKFYWTLTGTNSGTNGTGNKVRISGYEEWLLNDEGLIQESKGFFDEKDYKRQLENGMDQ